MFGIHVLGYNLSNVILKQSSLEHRGHTPLGTLSEEMLWHTPLGIDHQGHDVQREGVELG